MPEGMRQEFEADRENLRSAKIVLQIKLIPEIFLPPSGIDGIEQQSLRSTERIEGGSPGFCKVYCGKDIDNPLSQVPGNGGKRCEVGEFLKFT